MTVSKNRSKKLTAILALDANNGLGINSPDGPELAFQVKEDMQHFREMTKDKTLVVGFKTLPSILPLNDTLNRKVVLFNERENVPGVINMTKSEILKLSKTEDVIIVGGAKTYMEFGAFTDEIYLTKFYDYNPDCNVFLDIDNVYTRVNHFEVFKEHEKFKIFHLKQI